MCLGPSTVHTRLQDVIAKVLVYGRHVSRRREGLLRLPQKSPGAGPFSPQSSVTHSPIRQDTLSDLTHEDEEQHEGKDPAEVVAREMEPGAVVNVHLGALAAPSCRERRRG